MEIKRAAYPLLEFKETGDTGEFTAYVSVFGNKDSYGDVIESGAFTDSIQERGDKPFPLLYQHDSHEVIGGFRAIEDHYGLKMAPGFFNLDTQRGKEAYSNAKKGLLTGFSIGYTSRDFEITTETRVLKKVDLWEGSIVTFPANPKAQLIDIKELPSTEREFEAFLRDAGFSKREAKRIVAQGFRKDTKDREESGRDAHNDALIQKVDEINVKLRSLLDGNTRKKG